MNDPVLRHTAVFRRLLQVSSRPGNVVSLADLIRPDQLIKTLNPLIELITLTLCDVETSFCFSSNQTAAHQLAQLSASHLVSPEQADLIVILLGDDPLPLIETAKTGDLISPDRSASLLIEVEKLSADQDYALSGPGIKDITHMGITGLDRAWVQAFTDKNSEFPCGIDLFLIDQYANLSAIMRTTKVVG